MNLHKLKRLILNRVIRKFPRFFLLLNEDSPLKIEVRKPSPGYPAKDDRFSYQKQHALFDIKPGDKVLDIGCGDYPFPLATVLADKYEVPVKEGGNPGEHGGKRPIVCDIQKLPFGDKSFGFVYCSHVLEHVEDPIKACSEMMRVGRKGFIETPTFGKDILFSWPDNAKHIWHVVSCGKNLCFFEYSDRQKKGIESTAWWEIIFSKWEHNLQKNFWEHQDLFNVIFLWEGDFGVFVFRLNGTFQTLNAEIKNSLM